MSQQRLHRCLRCGDVFECPHGEGCQAEYDVLPNLVDPVGNVWPHCPVQPDWNWIRERLRRAFVLGIIHSANRPHKMADIVRAASAGGIDPDDARLAIAALVDSGRLNMREDFRLRPNALREMQSTAENREPQIEWRAACRQLEDSLLDKQAEIARLTMCVEVQQRRADELLEAARTAVTIIDVGDLDARDIATIRSGLLTACAYNNGSTSVTMGETGTAFSTDSNPA